MPPPTARPRRAPRPPARAAAAPGRFCGRGRGPAPRTVVVCAHPDDESVGAGARLGALGDVAVVHVTDGAPADMRDAAALGIAARAAYAGVRRAERRRALALAGVAEVEDVGLVDQEASLHMADL